jgi:hypothetical protein
VLCAAGFETADDGSQCRACPTNHVRAFGVNAQCSACTSGRVANSRRDACLAVNRGLEFDTVTRPDGKKLWVETTRTASGQFCGSGSFQVSGGDLLENSNQYLPLAFGMGVEKGGSVCVDCVLRARARAC